MKKTNVKTKIVFVMLFFYQISGLFAQNEANTWTFGSNAMIKFVNSGPTYTPTALPNSAMSQNEGVATISDENGDLLFYTNGQTIWNNQNVAVSMPSNVGLPTYGGVPVLGGDGTSTQSAVVIPNPDPNSMSNSPYKRQYYLFTVDAWGGTYSITGYSHTEYFGIRCALIEVTKSGNATVITILRSKLMYSSNNTNTIGTELPVYEKITAVAKNNYSGYYIISHARGNSKYLIWDITCDGNISNTVFNNSSTYNGPVECIATNAPGTSNTDITYSSGTSKAYNPTDINNKMYNTTLGYMRTSPDGTKIAMAVYTEGNTSSGYVEIVDFDPTNGLNVSLTNRRQIRNYVNPYGLEFSKTGNFLYFSSYVYNSSGKINKYNVLNNTLDATNVAYISEPSNEYVITALQLAPDENIYVCRGNKNYLARINSPDNNPTFQDQAFQLYSGATCKLGFPNFITSFMANEISIGMPGGCEISLTWNGDMDGVQGLLWEFGDGTHSHDLVGIHTYYNGGTYTATLTITYSNGCTRVITQSVTTLNCCLASVDPAYQKIWSDVTISSSTIWHDKIYIDNGVTVTVDNGATLDITNVDVVFGECARIFFKNGATIRANNSVFRSCNSSDTWTGIDFEIQGGEIGQINECTFKNATRAINFYKSASVDMPEFDFQISNNLFSNNNAGIWLTDVKLSKPISGNTFLVNTDPSELSFVKYTDDDDVTFGCRNYRIYDLWMYGIVVARSEIESSITQNDFIMSSNVSSANRRLVGISSTSSSGKISNNNFTNNSRAVILYRCNVSYGSNYSIENNEMETIAGYDPNQHMVILQECDNVSVSGNTLTNMLNDVSSGANFDESSIYVLDCAASYEKPIIVRNNTVNGFETAIQIKGSNYTHVLENTINKSWFYGVYMENSNHIDVSCNFIDMDLHSGRDVTGIACYLENGEYENAIRSNCVLNTRNAIYTKYNLSGFADNMPLIINNFLYNYTNHGLENYSLIGASVAPYNVVKNSFVSNNSATSPYPTDVLSNTALVISNNFGVFIISTPVSAVNINKNYSSASCATQVEPIENNIMGDDENCDFYFGSDKKIKVDKSNSKSEYEEKASDVLIPTHENILTYQLSSDSFSIYPNPAHDFTNLLYNISGGDLIFEIYNTCGVLVKSIPVNYEYSNQKINVSDLVPGVYFIKLKNSKVNNIIKLIKN